MEGKGYVNFETMSEDEGMFFGNKEKQRKSRELDSILDELRRNLENNYKDAAQQDLKDFENLLKECRETGTLSAHKLDYYEQKLAMYQSQLKKFTHKDQKVTW